MDYYFSLLFSLTLLTETAQTCIVLYLYSHITFISKRLVKKKKKNINTSNVSVLPICQKTAQLTLLHLHT